MGHHPDDLEWIEHGVGPVYAANAAPTDARPLMGHMRDPAMVPARRPKAVLVSAPEPPNPEFLRRREAGRAAQRERERMLREEYRDRIRREMEP